MIRHTCIRLNWTLVTKASEDPQTTQRMKNCEIIVEKINWKFIQRILIDEGAWSSKESGCVILTSIAKAGKLAADGRETSAKVIQKLNDQNSFIFRPFISWMFVFTVYGSQSFINHHTYPICCSLYLESMFTRQTFVPFFQVLVNPFKLHQKRSISVAINSQDPCGNPRWKLMVNGKRISVCICLAAQWAKRKRLWVLCFNFRPLGFDPLNRRITSRYHHHDPFHVPSDYLMHSTEKIQGEVLNV